MVFLVRLVERVLARLEPKKILTMSGLAKKFSSQKIKKDELLQIILDH